MAQYIDKDAVVAEIDRRLADNKKEIKRATHKHLEEYFEGYEDALVLFKEKFLATLEVKEVDLDALGVLAEHLIACDAHLVTPKYTDKELGLLEEWAKNNKARKGE